MEQEANAASVLIGFEISNTWVRRGKTSGKISIIIFGGGAAEGGRLPARTFEVCHLPCHVIGHERRERLVAVVPGVDLLRGVRAAS